MHQWSEDTFWQYSLRVYDSPGVKACCLSLQDNWNLNVNMLLLGCYLQQLGVSMSSTLWQSLETVIAKQDTELRAHREKRIDVKSKDADFYRRLLSEELELERVQQAMLIQALDSCDTSGPETDNLLQYAVCSGKQQDPRLLSTLKELQKLANNRHPANEDISQ